MAQQYRSKQGDTLDEIAWRQYGAVSSDMLTRIMDANPGLADLGPIIPAGVIILLPDAPETSTIKAGVTLWD